MSRTPQDTVLGHADEADGIEEYDNPLPTWWLGILWFTVAYAVVYTAHYHLVAERSQAGEYDAEMAAAEQRWPTPDPTEVVVATTPEAADAGAEIYKVNCVPCHGPDLSGGIGPSLVDVEWIHGESLEDITRTISAGVPEKGMISWAPILGPEKVAQVAAFVKAQAL